jgi:hypothetical protein
MQNEVYLIVKFQGKPGQQEALQSALADLQAGSTLSFEKRIKQMISCWFSNR